MDHHAHNNHAHAYGAVLALSKQKATPKRPAMPALVGCLFVPWIIFAAVFWLRSFDVRRECDRSYAGQGYDMQGTLGFCIADAMCFCLLAPILAFGYLTCILSVGEGDPKPMALITVTALIGWIVAMWMGNENYQDHMRPYYDINDLAVYHNVDPSKYTGNQLMDAGMIHFSKGSRLDLAKAMGFKSKDIYCVAPIVKGSNMSTYDYWVVGTNCCSPHHPDFQCGEYTNPDATWGLRLMDESLREFFRLAVQQASITWNLNAPNPKFMYWLADPMLEVQAHVDEGWKSFLLFVSGAFAVQLFLVVLLMLFYAKL
jgi:hypothetical protein